MRYAVSEEAGRDVGGLPLHPAAELFYRRDDAITSDRLGRLSFVASAIAGLFAAVQFVSRFRRDEQVKRRRRLLADELGRLQAIRRRIEAGPDAGAVRAALREADHLLLSAEQDAAMGRLDAEGIEALRSLHRLCGRAADQRLPVRPTVTQADPAPRSVPELAHPPDSAVT
jgi:hypothetical protein